MESTKYHRARKTFLVITFLFQRTLNPHNANTGKYRYPGLSGRFYIKTVLQENMLMKWYQKQSQTLCALSWPHYIDYSRAPLLLAGNKKPLRNKVPDFMKSLHLSAPWNQPTYILEPCPLASAQTHRARWWLGTPQVTTWTEQMQASEMAQRSAVEHTWWKEQNSSPELSSHCHMCAEE